MRSARLSVMDRRAFSFRAHAGASHVGDIRCRPNAPYMDVHQWHTTDRHPYTEQRGRRFAPCQGSQAPPTQGTEPPGGKPRPRRVGFGADVKAFRHISDRASGLQSQIFNGAARATLLFSRFPSVSGEGYS